MKTFPQLFHRTSKGNINVWNVWADGDTVFTRWGKQDGKMQESAKKVEEKNLGKANATSLVGQAEFEAQALWTHKLERKYVETLEETEKVIFLPMLAKKFSDRKKFLTEDDYPLWGQPKLDGVRCLASWGEDGEIHLMSRGGKEYILPHICREIEELNPPRGDVLDGELYVHALPLQQLNRLVRGSHKYAESVTVEYHVYDYCSPDRPEEPWNMRLVKLAAFLAEKQGEDRSSKKVRILAGRPVMDEADVMSFHADRRQEGYEGSIMRHLNGIYKFGYRSSDLMKVKSFQDDEFVITGFLSGVGKFKDCVIYWCQNESKTGGKNGDGTFKVVPKGSFEDRAVWLADASSVIGEQLKVEYAGYSDDLIPLCPIGICIRLPEDMDAK